MVRILLTGHTVCISQYWTYGRGQEGTFLARGSLTRTSVSYGVVDCDILTQGIIGLIEYSYHQGIPSFLEAQLKRTLRISVLDPEQF
jgi:hypothetical protein